jgi:hypothetical protein
MRLEDPNYQTPLRIKSCTPQLSPIEQAAACPRTTAGSDRDANARRIRILSFIFLRCGDECQVRRFDFDVIWMLGGMPGELNIDVMVGWRSGGVVELASLIGVITKSNRLTLSDCENFPLIREKQRLT